MKKVNTRFLTQTSVLSSETSFLKRSTVADLILRARQEEKKEKRNTVILIFSALALVTVSGLLISL